MMPQTLLHILFLGESKAGIITDLGVYTDEIVENFKNLDTVLIESNHDINMLMTGPYPYVLKQRILGGKGIFPMRTVDASLMVYWGEEQAVCFGTSK